MRATFMYGSGDVRVETVPDPVIQEPTDAIVRVVRACICGSDLHPYHSLPVGFGSLFGKNATLTGGPAPVRAYIEQALPDVLEGRINPGKVFDSTVTLDGVPAGYEAMDARKALKVLITL